jgi:tRNA A22 N-methylase
LDSVSKEAKDTDDGVAGEETARYRAQQAFSILARQRRTWKRLSHIVDMALQDGIETENSFTNIVDVGTDHGLLAMGFSLSGRFSKVIGIDISEKAFQNSLSLLEHVKNHSTEAKHLINPVEFRYGDGLRALNDGEGQIVCIAGMGANTMLQILSPGSELDRIQCTRLILQPTNSKPRNLILLYKKLQQDGWEVANEQIEKLSGRWYVTIRFKRLEAVTTFVDLASGSKDPALTLPGTVLSSQYNTFHPMRQAFDDYCQHHNKWILFDAEYAPLDALELQWLKIFGNQ